MFLTVALVLASPQARLDRLILEWCSVKSVARYDACVNRQRQGLRNFIYARTARYAAESVDVMCLRKAARYPSVDWTWASKCMEWKRTADNPALGIVGASGTISSAPVPSFASVGVPASSFRGK